MQTLLKLTAARSGDRLQLVTTEVLEMGTNILRFIGDIRATPGRYLVQIGSREHLHPPDSLADEPHEQRDPRFVWRFLDHSCKPNAKVVEQSLVALRLIQVGEVLTFDYNLTEEDMATPFRCECGHCGGRMIRGFKHRQHPSAI